MAKIIYLFKMYLFRDQFALSAKEATAVRELIKFILKIYVPAWYECQSAPRSPLNDLTMLQSIKNYGNKKIADKAWKAFSNHQWYLSEQLVGLGLFDCRVSIEEKEQMVQAMSKKANENPPKRIHILPGEVSQKRLSHFVTENTRKFLETYPVNLSWLEEHPSTWNRNKEYLNARKIFEKIKVVNDCAERGIGLAKNFDGKLTKSEEDLQGVFHVVTNHRKNFPNFKKSTLIQRSTTSTTCRG